MATKRKRNEPGMNELLRRKCERAARKVAKGPSRAARDARQAVRRSWGDSG